MTVFLGERTELFSPILGLLFLALSVMLRQTHGSFCTFRFSLSGNTYYLCLCDLLSRPCCLPLSDGSFRRVHMGQLRASCTAH